MNDGKRAKVQAILDNEASAPNEKEICRKLLNDPAGSRRRGVEYIGEVPDQTNLTMESFSEAWDKLFDDAGGKRGVRRVFQGECKRCHAVTSFEEGYSHHLCPECRFNDIFRKTGGVV